LNGILKPWVRRGRIKGKNKKSGNLNFNFENMNACKFKIGDKVFTCGDDKIHTVSDVRWEDQSWTICLETEKEYSHEDGCFPVPLPTNPDQPYSMLDWIWTLPEPLLSKAMKLYRHSKYYPHIGGYASLADAFFRMYSEGDKVFVNPRAYWHGIWIFLAGKEVGDLSGLSEDTKHNMRLGYEHAQAAYA